MHGAAVSPQPSNGSCESHVSVLICRCRQRKQSCTINNYETVENPLALGEPKKAAALKGVMQPAPSHSEREKLLKQKERQRNDWKNSVLLLLMSKAVGLKPFWPPNNWNVTGNVYSPQHTIMTIIFRLALSRSDIEIGYRSDKREIGSRT